MFQRESGCIARWKNSSMDTSLKLMVKSSSVTTLSLWSLKTKTGKAGWIVTKLQDS